MLAIIKKIDKFLSWVSIFFFVSMLAVVLLQVVGRYGLIASPSWTEEATRFLLIYLVAVSVGSCVYRRELVNVDVFINFLPPQWRRLLVLLIEGIILVFFLIFAYYVADFLSFQKLQNATTIPISMAYITFSLMVLCINSAVFALFNVVRLIMGEELMSSESILTQ